MNFYFEGYWHHKNLNGLKLMINEGMCVDFTFNSNKEYDWIVNLSELKVYDNHNGGVIYGPQILFHVIDINSVPNLDGRTYCNLLSKWNKKLCNDIHNSKIKCLALPFGVDVNRFIPGEKTGKPVIYFKHVDIKRLSDVIEHLGNDFIIFDYQKKYQEQSFNEAISKAPYAIWVGRHESQGFAFQETLSCNTPIFVIDIKSLRDEVVPNVKTVWVDYLPGHDLSGTAASYFDVTCGLISYPENWKEDFKSFMDNLDNYSPREFIVKNLSPKACYDLWIKTLSSL